MYKEQLKRQLDFLSRSCEIFDNGNQNEAIRIAVTLRTLFRDTNQSTSLMKFLGQQDSIKLLSTLETNDDLRLMHIEGSDIIPLMLTSEGQKPYLDTSRKKEEVFLCDWLSEVVLVLEGESFTRENIIVTAANKDGGTHVPKKLNRKAKLLKKSFGQYTVYENKRAITNELYNHHFIILRQLAYEVLNSKQLYELNDIEFCQPKEVKSYREYLAEADNYQKQKRFFKAIESYRKAIERRPEASEIAYNNMGNCFTELDEFNDAKTAYFRAINLNSEYVDPLFNLSRLYYREKRYDLAMSTYDQILQLDSKHKQASHNYHVLFNYLTLEKEVEYQYQNVFEKSTNINYLHCLCHGLMKYKRYGDALCVMQKAMNLSKDDAIVLCNMGVIYLKLKKYDQAEKIFCKLGSLDLESVILVLNLLEYKLIYNKKGHEEVIEKYMEKFNKDNIALMLLTMFSIFFKARIGDCIDSDLQIFESKFPNSIIDYNLEDIAEWILSLENQSLTFALSCFQKHSKKQLKIQVDST